MLDSQCMQTPVVLRMNMALVVALRFALWTLPSAQTFGPSTTPGEDSWDHEQILEADSDDVAPSFIELRPAPDRLRNIYMFFGDWL